MPLLGPVSLTGFHNAWFFLFLLIVLLVTGIYVALQFARRRRVLRFANMEVLERVAPSRSGRWRHMPTILLVTSLVGGHLAVGQGLERLVGQLARRLQVLAVEPA